MFNVAIFASGTGSNFKVITSHFKNSTDICIKCLICDQPEAKVVEIAKEMNINTFIVECTVYKTKLETQKEYEIVKYLQSHNIDLIVLAGYMRIVKYNLLDAYPQKIINIHPSLLPSFKGLNALKQALDYGVKITGCTVHFIDQFIDQGNIIAQRAVEITDQDDEKSLTIKIHREEHDLYPLVIENIAQKSLTRQNDHNKRILTN